ncbi:NAD(P)-dependent alcohol dehydrogenase [Dactylosporangium aurantiacum]|uniref:NAD(P)-dependent alcohol dehydrogenase n=1 Tax=Dactylosporangium aurantiacum TaxID=35754 RepID=A0A9Q9IB21_9ACTN|nr:NAD(P)-dependent alcohol dehydrogenase [Dactylosporangium aurantiacum]MDG6107890.1 NAD(P)-dependent alcohol dehydrogenase [Dactylosporangium aurantiacum]UWZ51801.1 NAD(P)-dependent alcohol dehydrogenase [Dactylosporangium aurantiacum]
MKAIVQDRYGPSDVLRLGEVEPLEAGPGEVLVRVHAASVNARDWHVMRGDPYLARLDFGLAAPKVRIRGTDFAGRVEAVGAGVTRLRPGDEVFGETDAAFAEYVRVPETGALETKPANLTFEQAAALPLAGNTALMGLRDAAGLRAGQHVLVNGASGGVGTFAVQLAKALGARVTGVCSTRNLDLVRSLGADHVVDYTREDFTRAGDVRYDVVFDLVGNRSLADCRRVLTPTGTLVLSGGGVFEGGSLLGPIGLIARGRLVSRFVRHRVRVLTAVPSQENLATLRELAESGALTPVIDRTFPFGEAAQAVRYLEVEHARAKVVLTV